MTRRVKERVLTAADMEVLEFERSGWWKYSGEKYRLVLERFGLNEHQYLKTLLRIVAMPAAETYDPETVRRLRRQIEQRRAWRRSPSPHAPEETR